MAALQDANALPGDDLTNAAPAQQAWGSFAIVPQASLALTPGEAFEDICDMSCGGNP